MNGVGTRRYPSLQYGFSSHLPESCSFLHMAAAVSKGGGLYIAHKHCLRKVTERLSHPWDYEVESGDSAYVGTRSDRGGRRRRVAGELRGPSSSDSSSTLLTKLLSFACNFRCCSRSHGGFAADHRSNIRPDVFGCSQAKLKCNYETTSVREM